MSLVLTKKVKILQLECPLEIKIIENKMLYTFCPLHYSSSDVSGQFI